MARHRPRHRVVIRDRGREHVHRFKVGCTCGWFSHTYRRTRRIARRAFRSEHTSHLPASHVTGRPLPPRSGPRPLTPHDRLPKELQ